MLFSIFASLLNSLFIGNILTSGIGLEALDSKEIRLKPVLIYTTIVSVLALISFLILYPILTFVLIPNNLSYLLIIAVVVITVVIVEGYRLIKWDLLPKNEYLPLNSVILLTMFMSISSGSFLDSLILVIGGALGFIGLTLIITTIQQRLRVSFISKSFKGLPIALIILGIIAIIFQAMGGVF